MQRWWLFFGLAGFLGYVPGLPAELRLLHLFLMTPLVRSLFRRNPQIDETPPPLPDLPVPPPARGAVLMVMRLWTTQFLAIFVPTMWGQMFRQLQGQSRAASRTVNSASEYRQKIRYSLPFDGEWYVLNGGITPKTSHSWDILAQRYAYDFVIVDEVYRRWRTDGSSARDYLCYGVSVCAPADGEVVDVRDGVQDAPQVGTGWLDVFTPHFPGNTVTIHHAEGEYSFFAHLIPGSLKVKVGMTVRHGQVIGLCGNSGHSTEPHLHFHFQDRADFWTAAGLPMVFDDVEVEGQSSSSGVYLIRGTRVRNTD